MRISCIRGRPKLIGKGLYRRVFKVRNLVLKIQKGRSKGIRELQRRAAAIDSHQRKIRRELTFLPAYYGTVLAEVRDGSSPSRVIITFHEYVGPLPIYSIGTLRAIFGLIGKASEKGYVLDIKPSNFGRKGKRVLYLDEYGIGKGPLPPDLLEDLNKLVKFALGKLTIKRAG
ncbi:MAG: hypothetical protein KAV43_04475 [Hadesarchaea archaeon]|nr:hypothetical protein [Hadesarchaea archaeon]